MKLSQLALLALATACTGTLKPGEGTPPGGSVSGVNESRAGFNDPAAVQGGKASSSVIRRLTRTEYNNTVLDLLGDDSHPADGFPADETALGFDNIGAALTVPPLLAEQYLQTAEKLSTRALSNLERLLPCASNTADEACALGFIRDFGERAWRRPLAEADVTQLSELYRTAAAQGGFRTGIDLVLRALLTSADFLFRLELGSTENAAPGSAKLDSWEVASRLSYLLWQTLPDATLFEAARSGRLSEPSQIAEQAQRLLGDARARQGIANFHDQWLKLRALDEKLPKDAMLFPAWRPEIPQLLREELHLLVTDIAYNSSDPIRDLLTTDHTFMNAPLAAYYGVSGPTGTTFERVRLDPSVAAGVLSRAGLLAVHAHSNQGSPTLRGKMIRERFLCEPLPVPPPTVNNTPPSPSATQTTRERLANHASDPGCASCHSLMDPIGFAFENFDAIGLYRAQENQLSVDAGGTLVDAGEESAFTGVPELGRLLATGDQVRVCVARQWFRFAFGKAEQGSADEETIRALAALLATGGGVNQMLVALTQTSTFLSRSAAVLP